MKSNADVARGIFDAYSRKDRALAERLLAQDFRFTSPLDNELSRQQYFEICWPNSNAIAGFDFKHVAESGDHVFVTYEGIRSDGKRFRNTEVITVRNGAIREVEVYFGWNAPHEVARGQHRDP